MGGSLDVDVADLWEVYSRSVFRSFLHDHPALVQAPLSEQLSQFRKFGISSLTLFFRVAPVLGAFEKMVLPSYPEGTVVKVASVGCSTGQEPYSLLMWNWDLRDRLQVSGYDINPRSIETAVAGEYAFDARPALLSEFKQRAPSGEGEAYVLGFSDPHVARISFTDEMKRRVSFATHDILAEPLQETYDAVLLLHVLMHYEDRGKRRILENVSDSMHDGGWLMFEQALWGWEVEDADMRSLGFERQRMADLPYSFSGHQGWVSQIYRKRESLRTAPAVPSLGE